MLDEWMANEVWDFIQDNKTAIKEVLLFLGSDEVIDMPDVYKYLTDVEVIRVNLTRRDHVWELRDHLPIHVDEALRFHRLDIDLENGYLKTYFKTYFKTAS